MKENEKYKLCLNCGNFCGFNENQIYCIVCGEKMIEKCKACHAPIIYPTGKFCHSCGMEYKKNHNMKNGDLIK